MFQTNYNLQPFGGFPSLIKRILSLCITLAVCFAAVPNVTANAASRRNHITDRSVVDGTHYTSSPALADQINAILDGDANIYADRECTTPIDTVLGTSPVRNNGIRKYVGAEDGTMIEMGTSCFIYANGVYYTLFGETAGEGEPGENSEMLDISKTASRRASYENFRIWGVRKGVGALIRASGHSMILLDYDEQGITYLDGNGDGKGLISVNKETWDEFFYSYVHYIIQPKEHHYSNLYATGTCGDELIWAVDENGTMIISGTGSIRYPGWSNYSSQIEKVVIESGVTGIGNGVFYNCSNLKEIEFHGTAPAIDHNAFLGVNATVFYPAAMGGWQNAAVNGYAGTLKWVPFGMTALKITAQPHSVCANLGAMAEISMEAEGDGLTYCWYVKHSDESVFVKSSASGSVYSMAMTDAAETMQVICVVKDQYGNIAATEPVYLRVCDTAHDGSEHLEPFVRDTDPSFSM